MPLRLSRDMAGRLREQAERDGTTANAYVLQAIKEKLDADEVRLRQRVELHRVDKRAPRERESPQGLNLRQPHLPVQSPPPPLAELAAPPPVVVNVGTPGPTSALGTDLIASLARYVSSGAVFERRQRHDLARQILRANAKSPEREALEQQLAQALTQADKADPRPGRLNGERTASPIGSLFR